MNRAFYREIIREFRAAAGRQWPNQPTGVIKKIFPTRSPDSFLVYYTNSIFLFDRESKKICFKANFNIIPICSYTNISNEELSYVKYKIFFNDGRVEELNIPAVDRNNARACLNVIGKISSVYISPDIVQYLPTILNGFNSNRIPELKITNTIGANYIDGKTSFVLADGRIDHNGEAKEDVVFKPLDVMSWINAYMTPSIYSTIEKIDLEAFSFFWDKFCPLGRIENVFIWAYAFSALFFYKVAEEFGEMGTYLYVKGVTNSGKTSRCRQILSFFGHFNSLDSLPSFDATINGLSAATSMINAQPVIMDDLRDSDHSNGENRQVQKKFVGLGNRSSRMRSSSNGRPLAPSGNTQHVIATGENPPEFNTGAMNRGIIIPFPESKSLLSESEWDLFESKYAPRLPSFFICFLKHALPISAQQVRDGAKLYIKQIEDTYRAKHGKDSNKRTVKYLSYIYFTFNFMMDCFQPISRLPNVEAVLNRLWEYILEIHESQLVNIERTDPGDQFLADIRDKRTGKLKVLQVEDVIGKTITIGAAHYRRELLVLYHNQYIYIVVNGVFNKYKFSNTRSAVTRSLREKGILEQEYTYEDASTNLPKFTLRTKRPGTDGEYDTVHGIEMYVIKSENIGLGIDKEDENSKEPQNDSTATGGRINGIDIQLEYKDDE